MFSGRSSRSHSASSRTREHENQHMAGQPPDIEMDRSSHQSDVNLYDIEEYALLQDNLLGQIILQLATDCTALARKSGLREMETDLSSLCQKFQQAMSQSDEKVKFTCAQVTAEENKRALDRELNSHLLNMEIAPPEYFSPTPVLTTPSKMADTHKLFPTRHKFSGAKRDGSMN